MKKNYRLYLYLSAAFLAAFVVWTILISLVDVQPIGPNESYVGFATINGSFHRLTGVCMPLYVITDWLGLIPIGIALGFAILGLIQWVKRKKLSKVDYNLFVLGGFYILVMAVYVFFEYVVVNRRPILIDGFLEASYPSSTTLLVLCVVPTAMMQLFTRTKNTSTRAILLSTFASFTAFMVVGRLISGVHWLTDIVGGILLATGLVLLYCAFCGLKQPNNKKGDLSQ
ncbi:MAG: phosphatase PAP2 family protein [Clostridia bacterium]|nr:phosphatase PAP2 family protein [Clostridia bacterium]